MSASFAFPGRRHGMRADRAVFAMLLVSILLVLAASCGSAQAREMVRIDGYEPGTIVISAGQRRLFFVINAGTAIRYPVAVGKRGHGWFGPARVDGKYVRPAWSPPASVKRDHPSLPDVIPGGSPRNPMGARALTLDRDEIAIHGTTAKMRASVGTAASYGCIRMYDEDVIDLFERVQVGTPVVMVP